MSRKKEISVCPINNNGCRHDNGEEIEVCYFWRKVKGCEIDALFRDLRSLPNLLRHIENQLEEGKAGKR